MDNACNEKMNGGLMEYTGVFPYYLYPLFNKAVFTYEKLTMFYLLSIFDFA